MTTPAPRLSFIVPVTNGAAHLTRCLESIRQQDLPADAAEVVVVACGSTDGSEAIARPLATTVVSCPPMNAASARNRAVTHARGPVLAFVDADHEIGPAWAATALRLLADPGVVAAGAPYHAPADGNWVQRAYDSFRRRSTSTEDTAWLASGNLAVRREAFERIGGFDATLETCEDVDLCYRLTQAGRLVSDPGLTSVHHGDPRSLRALFLGELWRGRDNLTVSFRHPLSLRDLPSVLTPVVMLLVLMAIPVGLATWTLGGRWVVAAAALLATALAGSRAVLMTTRRGGAGPITFFQSLVVACVYEVARAMALVGRAGHDVRRRA